MQKNNDASSLNIVCPEHNQYVQHVCLMNQCYQKLLCDQCLSKHQLVHKNQQIGLMEIINSFKTFQKVKLEDEDDLSDIQDQIKKGQRMLRAKDGKMSEIDYFMMSNLNGKDQEQKYKLFNEKAQQKKTRLLENEVKNISNEMASFVANQSRQILQFEKNIQESIQNQLRRATSTNIMEQKFLKDSSIQQILDDLKNNNNRYNSLSKNLQKFHKGYLELKLSKKIFSEMCTDTQTRMRTFQKNLNSFFETEYQKLFGFMLDTTTEAAPMAVRSTKNSNSNNQNKQISDKDAQVISLSELRIKLAQDKTNPNLYMQKMIYELEELTEETKQTARKDESETPKTGFHRSISYKKDISLGTQIQQGIQMMSPKRPVGGQEQQTLQDNLKSLNYQKKKVKLNMGKIEKDRFSVIQQLISPSKEDSKDIISIKNIMSFYQNPLGTQTSIRSGPDLDYAAGINGGSGVQVLKSPTSSNKIRSVHFISKDKSPQKSVQFADSHEERESQSVLESRKQSTADLSYQSTPRKLFNMNSKSDFKGCSLFIILVHPMIRSLACLELLQLQQSLRLSRPFTSIGKAPQQELFESLLNKKGTLVSSQSSSDLFSSNNNNSSDKDSILILQKSKADSSYIVGMEYISEDKFIVLKSDGLISSYQTTTKSQAKLNLIKDFQLNQNILCYNKPIEDTARASSSAEVDLLLFIPGQTSTKQSQLFILKYEQKKDKFFFVDQIPNFHSPTASISQIEVIHDKQFVKTNLPSSLQLVTDAFYIFSLTVFEDDMFNKRQLPYILVQRMTLHRDKHNSHEKSVVLKIEITQNIIIQRILFDSSNDFLWGHSDYQVFKWRIHLARKSLELSDSFTLIHSPNDMITSMLQNESMIMFTSLQGNLWGIDIMFNAVIQKDFQRFKYRTINNYAKIEGKDQIYIISGSKITINKNAIFVFSTLSSSGAKLICFNSIFRDVMCSIPGQQNHIVQSIYLPSEETLLGIEDFTSIRMWKNTSSKFTL